MEARRRGSVIHEAGHAVVAVALGGEILSVSIAADGTTGVCFHRGAYTTREEAAICAAGHAAEHLYRGRSAIRLPMTFDPHPELPSDIEKLEAMGDAADGAACRNSKPHSSFASLTVRPSLARYVAFSPSVRTQSPIDSLLLQRKILRRRAIPLPPLDGVDLDATAELWARGNERRGFVMDDGAIRTAAELAGTTGITG